MISRLALLILLPLLLVGCQTIGPASVKGGECRIFERPEYVVLGKRQPDQDWIDSQIEGGVGGCGWKRPKARPASFDAVPGQKAAPPPPKKKRGIIKRIRDRVVAPFTAPAEPVVEPPPPPIVVAPPDDAPLAVPPPTPPPLDPVDELLQPGNK